MHKKNLKSQFKLLAAGLASPRVRLCFFLLTSIFFINSKSLQAADEIKLKILAVNPSAKNPIESDITNPLPAEITAGDVLDAGGLDVKYDSQEKNYYLTGKVKLAPKESKTITVTVKDVWKISPERMETARKQITQKNEALKNTKLAETGELLYKKAMETLDQIESSQAQAQGIRSRIELYRANVQRLDQAQNDVLSIGTIREAQGNTGEERTAKFQITAENPSSEVRAMTVRADLPKEIHSEHVLDGAGFKVLFDSAKGRFVLEKQDEFKGNEKKTYQIVLKDIWYITPKEIEYLRVQTDTLNKYFEKSSYASYASGVAEEIERQIKEIESLQAEVADSAVIQDRIRAFILNSQKLNVVKAKVKELQDLMLELPLKVEVAEHKSDYVEGVRELQKVKGQVKLLTMGIKPNLSTTWWIILGIIGFLMILATIFYTTWVQKLKKDIYEAEKKK